MQVDNEDVKALNKAASRYVPIFMVNWRWCNASKEILYIFKFQNWMCIKKIEGEEKGEEKKEKGGKGKEK